MDLADRRGDRGFSALLLVKAALCRLAEGNKWTFDVTVSPIVVKYLTINKNVNHRGYTITNNG